MNGQQTNSPVEFSQARDIKLSGISVKIIKGSDLKTIYGVVGEKTTVYEDLYGVNINIVSFQPENDHFSFDIVNETCWAFDLRGSTIDVNGIKVGDSINKIENIFPESYQNRAKDYIFVDLIGTTHHLYIKFSPYTKVIERIIFFMD
ncbi:MAG: hypothetical protein ACPGR7_03125 [Flavobacteriaceae bacterium]